MEDTPFKLIEEKKNTSVFPLKLILDTRFAPYENQSQKHQERYTFQTIQIGLKQQ